MTASFKVTVFIITNLRCLEILNRYPIKSYLKFQYHALFWKIILDGNPLRASGSCHCSLGAWEAVSPLVGPIDKALETITS